MTLNEKSSCEAKATSVVWWHGTTHCPSSLRHYTGCVKNYSVLQWARVVALGWGWGTEVGGGGVLLLLLMPQGNTWFPPILSASAKQKFCSGMGPGRQACQHWQASDQGRAPSQSRTLSQGNPSDRQGQGDGREQERERERERRNLFPICIASAKALGESADSLERCLEEPFKQESIFKQLNAPLHLNSYVSAWETFNHKLWALLENTITLPLLPVGPSVEDVWNSVFFIWNIISNVMTISHQEHVPGKGRF